MGIITKNVSKNNPFGLAPPDVFIDIFRVCSILLDNMHVFMLFNFYMDLIFPFLHPSNDLTGQNYGQK